MLAVSCVCRCLAGSVMCTVVKCSQALVELFAGHLEFHCMYFALYCISASIGADTAEVGGIKRA